jgi:predicted amidohydrolase YtcJ
MIDTIIYNANIQTIDPKLPNSQAMVIDGDKIMALGENEQILKLAENQTERIDAGGNLILPGFIDAHLHLLEGSERLFHIQLRNAKSKIEFIDLFAQNLKNYKPGEWILGGDWNHESWGGELPNKEWIDEITPHNPVWVKRLDGHMGHANSLALQLCGIDKMLNKIDGGEILFHHGRHSGIFKDRAMELIESRLPEITEQQKERLLEKGMDYLAKNGVCSAHYLNLFEPIDFKILSKLKDQHRLKTRIYGSFPLNQTEELLELIKRNGKGDQWIRFGILKGFLDGSLGSQTALFFENYKNTTKNGLLITEPEILEKLIESADLQGLQVTVHAIGNKANHLLLNIYQNVIEKNGYRDRRFRIEHAQHVNNEDIKRYSDLNIIASMQALHLCDDGCYASKILEKDGISGSYPFADLINNNTTLAFGSDWFVSEPSPLMGIYAAATRQTFDDLNEEGWLPEQKIKVLDAIKAYTINAAYASFEENIKGSLSIGKLADFVMLDRNILEIDPKEIKHAKVIWTVLGGKTIYKNYN